MVTFLNSSILTGLFAALVPLIILLITRQKVKKVYYSSLVFLRELRSQKIRTIKLRQILLLIIRTLIILLLIIAFARPTLQGPFTQGFKTRSKSSIVIIIDNSLSMSREENGIRLLNKAVDKLNDLLEMLEDGDEIFMLYASPGAEQLYEGPRYSINTIRKILNQIEPSQRSTDIFSALVKAKQILGNTVNINKEIYVLTDMQEVGFEKFQQLNAPLFDQTDIKLFFVSTDIKEFSNLSVSEIKIGNQLYERGKAIEIIATITNNGSYDERDKMIQLFIDDKRVSQASVDVQTGSSKTVRLNFTPEMTGIITGLIVLEDDDLMADNRRYFTLKILGQTRILVATSESSNLKYLQFALNIFPNVSYDIMTKLVEAGRDFDRYDVMILADVGSISPGFITAIDNFLREGKALLIFPGTNIDIKNYNEMFGARYNTPMLMSVEGNLNVRESFVTFSSFDYEHPILSTLFEKKPEHIDSPKFNYFIKAQPNKESRTIISLSNNSPFLCETDYASGKIFLFTSSIDMGWSDLPYKSIYIPLLHQCINYGITNKYLRNESYLVDNEIRMSYKVLNEITKITIVSPDKNEVFISPELRKNHYEIEYSEAEKTGIYTLMTGNEIFDKWAINFDANELRFKEIEENTISKYLGADRVMIMDGSDDVRDTIMSARLGLELWKYVLLVVVLFIILEMIISREAKKEERG